MSRKSAVISRACYESVAERLPESVCAVPDLEPLANEFGVPTETLTHIHGLLCQRYVKMNHHLHKASSADYCRRYATGEQVCDISLDVNFPPCIIMRLLLDHMKFSKEDIKEAMSHPASIREKIKAKELGEEQAARLQENIEQAAAMDRIYSPRMDILRRESGLEYEERLCLSLRSMDIPFWTEDDLRKKGYVKTPDAKLQVPIAVGGRIVHWIDSKATFGDEKSHYNQYMDQYQQYVNRYGPGMVIYWFGFVRELQDNGNLLLVDSFPVDLFQLPRVTLENAALHTGNGKSMSSRQLQAM